jgi:hypothetical protein
MAANMLNGVVEPTLLQESTVCNVLSQAIPTMCMAGQTCRTDTLDPDFEIKRIEVVLGEPTQTCAAACDHPRMI